MRSEAGRESGDRPTSRRRRASRRARRCLAASGCAALTGAFLVSAPAGADGGFTNVAAAYATARMPEVTRTAWSLLETSAPAVAPSNLATASATDCTGCDATAVAFQVALASQASTLEPSNLATAIETACSSCSTVAVADQWVVADFSGRLFLTTEGRLALERVHLQLLALGWRRAGGQDVSDEAAQLASEVDDVLASDIVAEPAPPAPPGGTGHPGGWPLPGQPWQPGQPAAPGGDGQALARPMRSSGQSVSVLPEAGYTIYVYSQQDTGGLSPAGTLASSS